MNIIDKLYEDTPLVELASDIQTLIEEKKLYEKALELAARNQCQAFLMHNLQHIFFQTPEYWLDKARNEKANA